MMKKIFLILAVFALSATGLLSAYGDTPDQSRQWQPISEISTFECDIILNASKKPCARTLENADAFVLLKNLIIVRFQSGDEWYYSYGGNYSYGGSGKGFPLKISVISDEPSIILQAAKETYYKFIEVWNRPATANELTSEELAEADGLMQAYFYLVSQLPTDAKISAIVNDIQGITARGKRYASQLENLLFPLGNSNLLADFYDFYIHEVGEDISRDEDKPNDEEKLAALQKLINVLWNAPPLRHFTLSSSARDLLEKNDPAILENLIKRGLYQ